MTVFTRPRAVLLSLTLALLPGCADQRIDFDGDGAEDTIDCNAEDPEVFPGAPDAFGDGIDQNCDGLDGIDSDGDGAAANAETGRDCDDQNPLVRPGVFDAVGDGIDADCDGNDGTDADGDGFASITSGGTDCDDADAELTPEDRDGDGASGCSGDCDDLDPTLNTEDVDTDGTTTCSGDCDDFNAEVRPGAAEVCDGLDTDCDGLVADEMDADGDLDPACSDCDDADATVETLDRDVDGVTTCDGDCADTLSAVNPFVADLVGDGVDQNCDAVDGVDLDGDGSASTLSGGDDCDDQDPLLDGTTDNDGDGVGLCLGDCDDGNATVRPGIPELCNGIDDDCDGFATGEADLDGDGALGCADCNDLVPSIAPGIVEACDGVDEDCDGVVDNGFDLDGDGVTTCAGDCDDTDPLIRPGFPEACDGVDTNCDGVVFLEGDQDGDGWFACADCDDGDALVNPAALEICNGIDDDCDTLTDPPTDLDGDGFPACAEDCDDSDPTPCEAIEVAAGGDHTCALLDSGNARCWGWGLYGQLGYGTASNAGGASTPAAAGDVLFDEEVVQLAAGFQYTCASFADETLRCWGRNGSGQLGSGSTDTIGVVQSAGAVPAVAAGGLVTGVAAGFNHTCAVLVTGDVVCFGLNGVGQLGYGHTVSIGDNELPSSAGTVSVGAPVQEIALGIAHTCALLTSGSVRCWGSGQGNGSLGYGNTDIVGDDELPSSVGDVPIGGTVVQIALGLRHSCALLQGGAVRCWGLNSSGQLGYGHTDAIGDDETPASEGDVPLGGVAVQIATGRSHTCAVLDSGAVRCWGQGQWGQLGYGSLDDVGDDETPASVGDVPLGGLATQVSAGDNHTCALMVGGAVRCWGRGTFGQLGTGTPTTIGDDEPASGGGAAVVSLPAP